MRRGCIATGELSCDDCNRIIEHGERYLIVEEGEDERLRFCIDCCLSKSYAAYVMEKGENVLTLFPPTLNP